jgi:acyl CoA:acetate/3-ketoacid CoA transferase alpha subunit
MIDKIFPSARAEAADVADGTTVMIGGFGTVGRLIRNCVRSHGSDWRALRIGDTRS